MHSCPWSRCSPHHPRLGLAGPTQRDGHGVALRSCRLPIHLPVPPHMSRYWEKVTTGVKVKPWNERWRSADLELADTDVPRSCSLQNRSERREYPCRHWSCGWCLPTADKTVGGGEAKGGAAALLLHGRGDISVSGWPSAFHHPFGKFHRDGGTAPGATFTGHQCGPARERSRGLY